MRNSHSPPPSAATDALVSTVTAITYTTHGKMVALIQFLPGEQSLHLVSQGIHKVS